MSAHDKLERQLRASVARNASRRPARRLRLSRWSRGVSVLIVVGSTAVAVGVAVFSLIALHARQTSSGHPVAPTATHHSWLKSSATIRALAESARRPIAPTLN